MSQITKIKDCLHCQEAFEARRKNHRYCTASCRVMACYRRKAYLYISGRYTKIDTNQQKGKSLPAVATGTEITQPAAPLATGVARAATSGMEPGTSRSTDEITLAGIAENAIGAGLITVLKHALVDQHNNRILQEIHAMLSKILSATQQGQGIQQPQNTAMQAISKQQGMQPIITSTYNPTKGMGEEWM